jgi:hypothetical protein
MSSKDSQTIISDILNDVELEIKKSEKNNEPKKELDNEPKKELNNELDNELKKELNNELDNELNNESKKEQDSEQDSEPDTVTVLDLQNIEEITTNNENNHEKIQILINNCVQIEYNIKNIENDINKLSLLHQKLIANVSNKDIFYNYGVYADDVFFQKSIIEDEKKLIKSIYEANKRKIYSDFFRIYIKMIKSLLTLNIEYFNLDASSTSITKYIADDNVKVYSILNYDEYTSNDIIYIFKIVMTKIKELEQSIQKINNLIDVTKANVSNGYSVKLMLIAINGEKQRLIVDYNISRQILDETVDISVKLSEKYLERSINLANEIKDSENEIVKKIS